jgi:hypothetical protein
MLKKAQWMIVFWFVAIVLIAIILHTVSFGATAGQIQVCSVAVTPGAGYGQCAANGGHFICGPAAATDPVRTQSAAGVQLFEPFSTLNATSAVVSCPSGGWSTLAAVGAVVPGVPAPPPVTPPPPVVVPVDYTVITGFRFEQSYDAGQSWDPIETTLRYPSQAAAHCFRITALTAAGAGPAMVSCPLPK